MEKINIAELLKDCPKGMELDCTMFEGVFLERVNENVEYPIAIRVGKTDVKHLTKEGCWNKYSNAKCVIFPKGKTTWEGFQRPFKDGDVVFVNDEYSDATFTYVAILKRIENNDSVFVHCFYNYDDDVFSTHEYLCDGYNIRFATEEEKAKLIKAINDNGYKWNPKTKTLEKLPKFKVGDRIRHKCPEFRGERIVNICCDTGYFTTINDWIDIAHQDDWELVPNELEKLVEPKFKVGDKIEDCKYGYRFTISEVKDDCYLTKCGHKIPIDNQDDFSLVPNKFDINTLKPFDKVLVRDFDNTPWEIEFFSRLLDGKHFRCLDLSYMQCIPYEPNKELLGTTDDCDEFYKTWK